MPLATETRLGRARWIEGKDKRRVGYLVAALPWASIGSNLWLLEQVRGRTWSSLGILNRGIHLVTPPAAASRARRCQEARCRRHPREARCLVCRAAFAVRPHPATARSTHSAASCLISPHYAFGQRGAARRRGTKGGAQPEGEALMSRRSSVRKPVGRTRVCDGCFDATSVGRSTPPPSPSVLSACVLF